MGENKIFVDIGSTIIKYFRLGQEGEIIDGGFFYRDYDRLVSEQITDILEKEIGWMEGRDSGRICSSANGGLAIGIVGYTELYSSSWAAKAAFNSGANVRWSTDLKEVHKYDITPVDILVIAGGANKSPIKNQLFWIDEINKLGIKSDAVVFAGNCDLAEKVKSIWPSAIIADNVLGEDMSWNGQSLSHILRAAYLNDLVLSKGIAGLEKFSEVPIFPTPAVVQKAYDAILLGESSLHYPTPFVLIDIGGATTDLFYGGELVEDGVNNQPCQSTNRYVFSYLGVSASKNQLLNHLSLHKHLGDFLRALDEKSSEQLYLALKEGCVDWVTPEFLAEACFFLALSECFSGLVGGHKIAIGRASAVIVTGGASQICDEIRLQKLLDLFGVGHVKVILDYDYQVWIEGMTQLNLVQKGFVE
jgi:hypothetical protein